MAYSFVNINIQVEYSLMELNWVNMQAVGSFGGGVMISRSPAHAQSIPLRPCAPKPSTVLQWNLFIMDTLGPAISGSFLLLYRGFPLSEVKMY